MAVNPQSHYVLQRGPGQILSLPTTHEKATATIPYLLDAFANLNPMYASTPTFAPWTWSTLDPDMARAIEDGLKEHGVKPELCKVTVCTAEEQEIGLAITPGSSRGTRPMGIWVGLGSPTG
ncbi:hypothetical protein V8F33_002616 [Rhypophila sp. PSN 637]